MTNKRKRPGKSQRANTVAKAVRIVRAAKVTANQAALDAEKAKPNDYAAQVAALEGPNKARNQARLSGGCSKERLKLGSYGVGFQGPRGFASPTDKVHKREVDGQALSPRAALAITAKASQRFAEDDFATDKPERGVMRKRQRRGKRERVWKRIDLNAASTDNDAGFNARNAADQVAKQGRIGKARREAVIRATGYDGKIDD